MTLNTIPQQQNKNVMKQNKEIWIVRIVMVLSLAIGYLLAYYFSNHINKWLFDMDMIESNNLVVFGISASLCLFIGGYIKGRLSR
jgi:membrane protein YdbS with pleckstrin-like domain